MVVIAACPATQILYNILLVCLRSKLFSIDVENVKRETKSIKILYTIFIDLGNYFFIISFDTNCVHIRQHDCKIGNLLLFLKLINLEKSCWFEIDEITKMNG